MSNRKCCVPGCVNSIETQVNLHKFPNPAIDKKLFNTWVYAIGGDILHLENNHIFKYRRVCHVHFEEQYWCRYNRITKDAVPTINMPGLSYLKFNSERQPLRPLQMFEPSTSKEFVASQLNSHILNKDVHLEESLEPVTSNLDSVAMQLATPSARDVQMKENLGYHSAVPGCQIRTHKRVKHVAVTQSEYALYKKLLRVRVKLSKCRKVKDQAKKIKALKNIATNPQFLKTLAVLFIKSYGTSKGLLKSGCQKMVFINAF